MTKKAEIQKLVDELMVYKDLINSDKINIDFSLAQIQKAMNIETKSIKTNSAKFKKEFDKRAKDKSTRCIYLSILHISFNSVIKHYLLGNNSLVIIELHAILERGCLDRFPIIASEKVKVQNALSLLIKRKTLPDLIEPLIKLGIWDDTDKTYAKRIGNLRNGIAHKNIELVSKYLFSGKPIDKDEIISKADKKDCLNEIFGCFDSYIKLLQ